MTPSSSGPRHAAAGSQTVRRPSADTNTNQDSSVPQKRPASWDKHAPPAITDAVGNNNTAVNRPTKRRAPRACITCRDRKVRCDVMSGGRPCTNCRLDDVECILKQSNRGKHNSLHQQARARTASFVSVARPSSQLTTMDIDVDGNTATSASTTESAPAATSFHPNLSASRTNSALRDQNDCQAQVETSGEEISVDNGDEEEEDERGQQSEEAQAQQMRAPTNAVQEIPHRQVDGIARGSTRIHQHQQQGRPGSTPHSTSSAPAGNPQTSDYLVALAFEGQDKDQATASRRHSFSANYINGSGHHLPVDQGRNHPSHTLPRYIRPHPSHLDAEDIQYLALKDCLTIPDDELRDELLRIYVFVVYPFMPAVDLGHLLGVITGENEGGTISLLLFHAIMFASVTFIDVKQLQSRGFESKRAARRAFFNRVKLLYSLDYESDRLTLVQSLLLMTYWYDSDSDDKHTWYWMGIALTTAQVEGLHRDIEEPPHMASIGRLRRRIWWSCVIRDRLLGLGIRRPSRIREDEFSVEPLCMEDFDLAPSTPAAARLLAAPSYTGSDPVVRQAMATVCVDLSKLCIIIGRILHSQYTIGSSQQEGSNYLRKAIVRPQSSKEQSQSFTQCDKALHEWLQSRAPESKYEHGARNSRTSPSSESSMIRLHQALLYMNYLLALGALHRPQVFYSGSDGLDLARKADSKRKVTEAAVAITKLAFDLQSTNQMCYAPTSSIPAFLSAALIHLLNTRSSDEETRNISIGRFCQCLDALHQLQSMYAAADQAVHIVNNVLENADLMVPLLGAVKPNPTTGSRLGNTFGGVGPRQSLFPEIMLPSRVATAYPSPAAHISHVGGNTNGHSLVAPDGVTGQGLENSGVREASNMASYNPLTVPLLMNIWGSGGNAPTEKDTPLPTDGMPGFQFDADAWYDVGDILDPGLMNFDMAQDFVPTQVMPM